MKKLWLSSLLLLLTMATFAQEVSKELMKQAKKGDIEAQLSVAKSLMKTGENPKAAKWLYQAAKAGNKEAENMLFSFYSKELEKYAKEGNAEAQFQTGECYYNGNGTGKDLKKAAMWYDLATAQNHATASERLGSFYNPQLVKRAKEGDSEMQYRLGLCYLNGVEVGSNVEDAAEWLEKAMLEGHKEAGQQFFATDSKLKEKRIKTLHIHPMMMYTGYAPGNIFKGYDISASPVADVVIIYPSSANNGNFNMNATASERPIVTIKGKKEDDLYIDAVLEYPDEDIKFNGNLLLKGVTTGESVNSSGHAEYRTVSVLVSLAKGGKLNVKGHNFVLEDDYTFELSPSRTSRMLFAEAERNIADTTNVTMPVGELLKSAVWLSDGATDDTSSQLMAIKAADIAKASVATCDLTMVLGTNKSGSFQFFNLLPDTIRLGEDCLYRDKENGNVVLMGKNQFDKIVFSSPGRYDYFSKNYKDGLVRYDTRTSESEMILHNGERFKGVFQLGDLVPNGSCYNIGVKGVYGGLKALWNKEKISDLPFVIIEGMYTDAKGMAEEWKEGVSQSIINEAIGYVSEKLKKTQEEYKKKKAAVKKQLIAEGFNAVDVTTLLDRCSIRKGMSRRLIERANDLDCNLTIVAPMNVDDRPRLLIEIVDVDTWQLVFHAFVGFNIFNEVSVIELGMY